jgi:ribose 5-phosphate isomerase RpiB
MGTDLLTEDQMRKIVEIFLSTAFEEGRHTKRVAKLDQIMG